jgi:hypothetical protein
MIQFNLLPDVKIEFMKVRRMKRVVMTISVSVAVVSLILASASYAYLFRQKQQVTTLTKDISSRIGKIESTDDLVKILTVQNQLNALPGLYQERPAANRLLGYLSQMTPLEVTISRLSVDYDGYTIEFEGKADSLSSVNKFADVIKLSVYKVVEDGSQSDPKSAFNNVVLRGFGLNDQKTATFDIGASFDPLIFQDDKELVFEQSTVITTRSTSKPNDNQTNEFMSR